MKTSKQLSPEAQKARREYFREYRRRNAEKIQEYRRRFWEKRAVILSGETNSEGSGQ